MRYMWEIGTEDEAEARRSFVNVANGKIYQVKSSDDEKATVFTVWLAQTGQMISTTRLDFGPVFKCCFPEYRRMTEPVRLILIKTRMQTHMVSEEKLLTFDIESGEVHIFSHETLFFPKWRSEILSLSKDFLFANSVTKSEFWATLATELLRLPTRDQVYAAKTADFSFGFATTFGLDAKPGVCHVIDMWRAKEPLEYVITSFNSADNTSKKIAFKTKHHVEKSKDHIDVHIVYHSFVSLRPNQDKSSLILTVEPFPTGSEATEEYRKWILDLDSMGSTFELFCAPSKALVVVEKELGFHISLLNFNI